MEPQSFPEACATLTLKPPLLAKLPQDLAPIVPSPSSASQSLVFSARLQLPADEPKEESRTSLKNEDREDYEKMWAWEIFPGGTHLSFILRYLKNIEKLMAKT